MPRQPIKQRKLPKTIEVPGMIIERGPSNVKPPTEAQKKRMKNLEYIRKHPTSSI